MNLATVMSAAVCILFVVTGSVKLLGLTASLEIRDSLEISPTLWRAIGALELAGALGVLIGLWSRPLALSALGGLACLMAGAIVARIRVRGTLSMVLMDVCVLAFVVATLALSVA